MSQSGQAFQPPKSWELSMYELHRTPQEAITDETEIALSPRSLHSELMCPICLDMLTSTMTTKECLHRFCHDCIITALRAGNKECPTCRKKLISKRSLRPDPNFDSLIEKIYPDRDEYEAHQEKVLEKLNQHTNQQALTSSIEEGLRIQAQNRLQRMLKQQRKQAEAMRQEVDEQMHTEESNDSTAPSTPHSPTTPTVMTNKKTPKRKQKDAPSSSQVSDDTPLSQELHDIEVVFQPHPDFTEGLPGARYLKTTSNATILHLRRYLAVRHALLVKEEDGQTSGSSKDDEFNIFVATIENENFTLLEGTLTLAQIHQSYWFDNRAMELYYAPSSMTFD